MLADQFAALEIMVLDDELVEAFRFVRCERPDGQMFDLVVLLQLLLPFEPRWASFAPALRQLNDTP